MNFLAPHLVAQASEENQEREFDEPETAVKEDLDGRRRLQIRFHVGRECRREREELSGLSGKVLVEVAGIDLPKNRVRQEH